jgi:phosphate/sulfate permease
MCAACNDSVGSKTLKLWMAVVIAAIFEFLGALLLGGQVTRTIAGSIARVSTFRTYPAQFMFGACAARCHWGGGVCWVGVGVRLVRWRWLAGAAQQRLPRARHTDAHTTTPRTHICAPNRARSLCRATGMLTAETGACIWILIATYMELPVSTTHSISESRQRAHAGMPCRPERA